MSHNSAKSRPKSIIIPVIFIVVAFLSFELILRLSDNIKRRVQCDSRKVTAFCFGDDLTFGYGARPGETYPAELERSLNQGAGHDKFLIVNFGVLEANSSQTLRYLKDEVKRQPPDWVVILTGKNNIDNLTDSNYFLLKKRSRRAINVLIGLNYLISKIRIVGFLDALVEKSKDLFRPNKYRTLEWGYPGQGQDKIIGGEFRESKHGNTPDTKRQQSMRLRELKLLAKAGREKTCGRLSRAAMYLAEAVSLNPTNIWGLNELGMIYKDMGMPEQAKEYFWKAIMLNPEHSRAHIEMALMKYPEEQVYALPVRKRSELAYEEIENCPEDAADYRIHAEKAWFLRIFGEHVRALDELEKAEALNPGYGRLYFERGLLLEEMQKYEAAIAEFRKAVEISPGDHLSYFELGLLLRKTGEYALSLEEILKASNANVFSADYHLQLGMAYGLLGKYDLEEKELNKAVYLKPCSYAAYLELADLAGKRGDNKAASENKEEAEKYFSLLEYDLSSMIGFLKAKNIGVILLVYPEERNNEYIKKVNSVITSISNKFSVPVAAYGYAPLKDHLIKQCNLTDKNG
jgi:tetratricopeptide (TPR) repeat protein